MTDKEAIALINKCIEKIQLDDKGYAERSCYKCNSSHKYLHEDKTFLFHCFSCGVWYIGKIDLSELSLKYEDRL